MVEVLSTVTLLTLFGFTVVIGYLGNLIFQKSKIPDIIWLMFFGIMIGPVFSIIDIAPFLELVPFLSSLALLIILFDAGLHMNIYRVIQDTPRSLAIAISGLIVSMILAGSILMIFFNIELLHAILLGAVVGGTSSPIVLSLVKASETEGKIKNLLNLESALTDALTIIVSLFILNIILSTSSIPLLSALLGPFSIGSMIGLIAGMIWLFALDKLKGLKFTHMLTLSIVFILYAFVELASGSGPLAALFFGIVIGNGKNFSIMFKLKKIFEVGPEMKTFQDEITFFIRSFFFVLLGLMVVINAETLMLGIIISIVLIFGRVIAAEIGMIRLKIPRIEKNFIRIMTPRGLAAAVLAQVIVFSAKDVIPIAQFFADMVFVIILVTVIYSSIVTMILSKKIETQTIELEKIKNKKFKQTKKVNKVKNKTKNKTKK